MVLLALFQTKFVTELWIVKIVLMNSIAVSLFFKNKCKLIPFEFRNIFYQFKIARKTNLSARI